MAAPIRERLKLRLLHWSFLLARPMTLGVRGIVAAADERILLVRHGYPCLWESFLPLVAALGRDPRESAAR